MKVFLLADRPTRNRVEFWNLLGKQCDLTIAFESYPAKSKVWEYSTVGNNFKSMFLQGLSFGENINISFDLGKHLDSKVYNVYALSGCESFAEKSAIKEIKIKNKNFVLALEGGFPDIHESNLKKQKKAKYMQSASYYLSCGSTCDAYLSSYGVRGERIVRYSLAAFSERDFSQATPMTSSREKGLKNRFRLMDNIFISTIDFTKEQGIDILLDIWKFAGIKNANLLIVSDGSKQKRLKKLAQKLALNNIVMIDYQPKEITRELYRISTALIYPARHDIWGLPVVEALSCALPVISSYNVGAVHDLVHDGRTGFIQNIHEPIAWGVSMREMLKRDKLKESMQSKIAHTMRGFTIDSAVDVYIDVFKKCAIQQK